MLEDKRRPLAYFHDDENLYMLGLPPGGFEILRGKDQIQPMSEENIASHFKMQVEVFSVVDDSENNLDENSTVPIFSGICIQSSP